LSVSPQKTGGETMPKQLIVHNLGCLLQDFFCQRLIQQRRVSSRTVASYRDTFRLFLRFAERKLCKQVTELVLTDLDVNLVLAFLDYLEIDRQNNTRSRNARLAAIRSFLHYAGLQEPSALSTIQRVFAVPMKRFEKPMISFLTLKEIEMIMDAPDPTTWSGRRDRVLFAILYNTGARVSEVVNIKCVDVENRQCTALHIHGKGRKQRIVPLWKRTSHNVRQWLHQIDQHPQSPLFPNRFGREMTRSGVEKQLQAAVIKARKKCPSLEVKKVSPHTIRHTTAMHLLQSGVDLSVIALWLGHESIVTTHHYMQADLEMKKQALNRMKEPKVGSPRFKPQADVLAFLDLL
jgi:site-specific recombinase XerD